MAEQVPHDLKDVGLNSASGSYETITLSLTLIDGYLTNDK